MNTTEYPYATSSINNNSKIQDSNVLPSALAFGGIVDNTEFRLPGRFVLRGAFLPLRILAISILATGWFLTYVSLYLTIVLDRGNSGSAIAKIAYTLRFSIAAVLLLPGNCCHLPGPELVDACCTPCALASTSSNRWTGGATLAAT